MSDCILEVALPVPLVRYFEYRFIGSDLVKPQVGQRVQVPFGRTKRNNKSPPRKLIGIITAVKQKSDYDESKIKNAFSILDNEPLLNDNLIKLLKWSAQYYHFPPGAVFEAALPVWLRKKAELPERLREQLWQLTDLGLLQSKAESFAKLQKRAPVQAVVFDYLLEHNYGVSAKQLNKVLPNWRNAMRGLEKKNWVSSKLSDLPMQLPMSDSAPSLTNEQNTAIKQIVKVLENETFTPFLLQGVTGSGKTEVYLAAAEKCLQAGKQVLCLVPEIALTAQFIQRFEQRLQTPLAVLHSGVNDRARCLAWLSGQDGSAKVILGTRSAIFTPMKNPGLIIIDEEHDSSFKQQDGFRYSARDLALVRAKNESIPVVLGSATPALESLHKAAIKQYQHLVLKERPGKRPMPMVKLVDLKSEPGSEGLSYPLIANMEKVLQKSEQVLIFLNRRGYSPVLLCPTCMWCGVCTRCDVNLTYHHAKNRLRCHHCNKDLPAPKKCPACKADVKPLGQGTERIESFLRMRFPDTPVIRIDRDTTRSKEQMQKQLESVHAGGAKILVGTQMLTKGHDFPDVTLVGVLDADGGLYTQVANNILKQRAEALWPPFSNLALMRVESQSYEEPMQFLNHIKDTLSKLLSEEVLQKVSILGPAYAPMAKRAGFFRAQLLFQSEKRAVLHQALHHAQQCSNSIKHHRSVRWSLDIDPSELY